MSYSEPLLNQVRVFFLSIGAGVFICLIYIAVQGAFRIFGKGKRVFYIADGVFCALFAFVSFFFMVLYNNGQVRLHLIFGEAVGFFVFYFSVGRHIEKILLKAAEYVSKGIGFMLLPVRLTGRHFAAGAGEIKEKIAAFLSKSGRSRESEEKKKKKIDFLGKIHLKNKNKSV